MEMVRHQVPLPVEDHEYLRNSSCRIGTAFRATDSWHSYEALPPNYSFGANMLAGAFAGILVSSAMGASVAPLGMH